MSKNNELREKLSILLQQNQDANSDIPYANQLALLDELETFIKQYGGA